MPLDYAFEKVKMEHFKLWVFYHGKKTNNGRYMLEGGWREHSIKPSPNTKLHLNLRWWWVEEVEIWTAYVKYWLFLAKE